MQRSDPDRPGCELAQTGPIAGQELRLGLVWKSVITADGASQSSGQMQTCGICHMLPHVTESYPIVPYFIAVSKNTRSFVVNVCCSFAG